jgi:hypothetical protein
MTLTQILDLIAQDPRTITCAVWGPKCSRLAAKTINVARPFNLVTAEMSTFHLVPVCDACEVYV